MLPKPPHTLPPRLPPGIKPSPIDWKELLGTVSLKDRLVAGRLHQTLGQHVNSLAGALAELKAGNATLKRGADGVMRVPSANLFDKQGNSVIIYAPLLHWRMKER